MDGGFVYIKTNGELWGAGANFYTGKWFPLSQPRRIGIKSDWKKLHDFLGSQKNIILEEQAEALDEVEIVYEMPVTIKGDTIVYNADSFNTGTEKKLGDVLKNLPGIEINEDGSIEVEGKEITKITVEGKDFFDGDWLLRIYLLMQ